MGLGEAVSPNTMIDRMNLVLVSENAELAQTIRDYLGDDLRHRWEFTAAAQPGPRAHLTIWEYTPGMALSREIELRFSPHVFLVDRKDIDDFRREFPRGEAQMLLKPMTRGTLTTYLEQIRQETSEPSCEQAFHRLANVNLKLQEYDQDRTNFLARGAHDLRVPLTAVVGYCGLMLSETLGSLGPEQREILERMQQSANRLSQIVGSMFELSIARNRRMDDSFASLDLSEHVKQALFEVGPITAEKLIWVKVDLEPTSGVLVGSGEQIERLIVNLLDNACKFTPRNGEIEIRGYPCFLERRLCTSVRPGDRRQQPSGAPNMYRVNIRNTGKPISNQHLETIFEEYTSCSGKTDRSAGGLGLAICRMIIRQHKGRIWAENTDRGPVFSFVLPLDRVQTGTIPAQTGTEVLTSAEVM